VGVLKLTLTDFARLLAKLLNPGSVAERSSEKNGINKPCAARRVSLNTRLMTSTVVTRSNSAEVCLVKKVLLTHTRPE
jgi:hypothetical protein